MNLSIKTLLFTSSLLFPAYAVIKKVDFLSQKKFTGTPKRTEFEFKYASSLNDSINLKGLQEDLKKLIFNITSRKDLKFSKQVFQKYYADEDIQSFIFKDIYLDTDNYDLRENKSAYRLRHRWVFEEKYYRYRLFPFIKAFHPNRCEIQYKHGYEKNLKDQTVKVFETRFEFRNESEPFKKRKDAPPSPWPEEEYIKYAQSGKFKEYNILPMKELLSDLPLLELNLKPIVKMVTTRYRSHLNINHPWGSGPNPDQVFIITLDIVRAESLESSLKKSIRFLELEVEIDRNTSFFIEKMSKGEFKKVSLEKTASEFSRLAKKNLNHDLKIIKGELIKLLRDQYRLKPLSIDNKYSRFFKDNLGIIKDN